MARDVTATVIGTIIGWALIMGAVELHTRYALRGVR